MSPPTPFKRWLSNRDSIVVPPIAGTRRKHSPACLAAPGAARHRAPMLVMQPPTRSRAALRIPLTWPVLSARVHPPARPAFLRRGAMAGHGQILAEEQRVGRLSIAWQRVEAVVQRPVVQRAGGGGRCRRRCWGSCRLRGDANLAPESLPHGAGGSNAEAAARSSFVLPRSARAGRGGDSALAVHVLSCSLAPEMRLHPPGQRQAQASCPPQEGGEGGGGSRRAPGSFPPSPPSFPLRTGATLS